jgi:hypothetical protein
MIGSSFFLALEHRFESIRAISRADISDDTVHAAGPPAHNWGGQDWPGERS